MAALETPKVNLGWKAIDFNLKSTEGKICSLNDVRGPKGLLVMFICNHCPFVKAILNKIIRDSNELIVNGIGVVAIMSNDTNDYPEDSFENMRKLAQEKKFIFPYLLDETQEIAKKYGAICTPDFFGFNANLELQYRGRLDSSKREDVPGAKRELFEAMMQIAKTNIGPVEQFPSIGCSIKWKQNETSNTTI